MSIAQRNLEIVYRHNGFYDRRIAELRERLRRRGDDREAHWELGRAYASVGQLDEAVAEFEAMIATDSADLGALLQLALVEQRRGRLDRALEWLQQAKERDADSSVVEFHRGEVLYNLGMNEESRAALERAVALSPDNADAWHLLAFVLGDQGLRDEARDASRKARELNPSLARAQTNLSLESTSPAGRTSKDEARPAEGAPAAGTEMTAHCGSTASRWSAARTGSRCARAWRSCTCCVATCRRRSASTMSWWPSSRSTRSCGTNAAWCCTSWAAATRRGRATGARSRPTRRTR
jgi:tetratricopeptide (TPR) repeat protein